VSRGTLGVCLVVGWMLMWGDLGVGTAVGGSAVVIALFAVFPSNRAIRPRLLVRPVAVARLVAHFVVQLVVSNALLTRELLRWRTEISSRVVEVPIATSSPSLLTAISNLAALSPGTMVVDVMVGDAGATMFVNVLTFGGDDDPIHALSGLHRLEELTIRAFGEEAGP